MKLLLDACVLFPPIVRGLYLGAAKAGLCQVQWSERILEEWVRATARLGAPAMAEAETERSLMRANFPRAMVSPGAGVLARLVLPDPNDEHVLAAAITGGSDAIVTFNAADFPRHILAAEGLERRDPDGLLWELHSTAPEVMNDLAARLHAQMQAQLGKEISMRALFKRNQLPRFAKAVTSEG